MKKMKKLLSLVLAVMLVLGMGSSVMASGDLPEEPEAPVTKTIEVSGYNGETGGGSLTISNGISDQTYTIFKMFDLESYDEASGAYSYKPAAGWEEFVENSDYVGLNDDGYVVWKSAATGSNTVDTEEFAKEAQAYAVSKNLTGVTVETEGEATDNTEWKITFADLPLGYYLLDSSMGALCSLDTTNPDVEIREKNEKPKVEKEVQQPTASVGDVLDYDVTIEIVKGAQNYKLHDKMSAGLTFDPDSVTVKLLPPNAAEGAVGTNVALDKYTLTTNGLTDGCTFEIAFAEGYCEGLVTGSKIVISYQAAINEDAVVGVDPVKNTAILDFGDDNHQTSTPPTEVTTDLYDLEITKIDGASEAPLTGAEFELENEAGTKITFTAVKDENGNILHYVATTGKDGKPGELDKIEVTSSDGKILIKGLAAGKYKLTEIKAPTGYNKLQEPIEVEIKENTVSATSSTATVSLTQVTVENNTGAELPSTGGIGTTIFYVLGGILVVGACIMLVVRKRMSSEE